MPRCIYLLVTLGFGWVSTATAVEIGQTWAEVQAELGKPVSQLDAGGRRIARWAALEVTFTDGCVSSQLRRDLASEASSEARRKEEAETTRKLREEIDADNRRREEDREAQEERDRPETERKALAARIAALEVQLEAERAKLQAMTEKVETQRSRDRAVRLASLRKELATLRLEISRALSDGEVQRAGRLREEMVAKDKELNQLARQTD